MPSPSAVVAAMLPLTSGGTACWLADFPQSPGSKAKPGGSVCGASSRGSMAAGPTVFAVNRGPKLDLTSATLAMSACDRSSDCAALHAANSPTHDTASVIFALDIAANVPAGGGSAAHRRHDGGQKVGAETGVEGEIGRAGVGDHRDQADRATQISDERLCARTCFRSALDHGRRLG